MPTDSDELTEEQIAKAMACETVEDLMALAKAEGVELTKEEAEAYLAELADFELDEATLSKAAGGEDFCWENSSPPPPCPTLGGGGKGKASGG